MVPLLVVALLARLPACESGPSRSRAALEAPWPENRRPTGAPALPTRTVLLQVQGLSGAWVERWLTQGRFLPESAPASPAERRAGGLWRLSRGAFTFSLTPVEPAVAAPNLASMVTGALPGEHAVLANRFLWEGRPVSGHRVPLARPPLWERARRAGRRVVTWLAPGARCQEPMPSGLRSVCHAGRIGVTTPRPALSVTLPSSDGLVLRAPPAARGGPRLAIGVDAAGPRGVTLRLPAGARLAETASPLLREGESRAILWNDAPVASAHAPALRLTWMTLLGWDPRSGLARFHDGGTAVGAGAPEAFAKTLAALELLRPAPADQGSLRRGRISPSLFAETALREVRALAAFAAWLGRRDRFDLAVLTLPSVDALARGLLAAPDRPELTPGEVAAHRAALEQALRAVDRHLGEMVTGLDLARTRVVVASDGGLLPVTHDVSLAAALAPAHPGVRVLSSGAAALAYLPGGASPETAMARLNALRVAGRRVLEGGRVERWNAQSVALPDETILLVQAGPGFTLSGRRRKRLTAWPRTMAERGHPGTRPETQGFLMAAGPGLVRRGDLGPLGMIDVAAPVCQAADLPADGRGRARPQGTPPRLRLWNSPGQEKGRPSGASPTAPLPRDRIRGR